MKENLVILDCDDVLLNYIDGFGKFVKEHYGIEPVGKPTEYDLAGWINAEPVQIREMMKHFNERSYQFGLLEAIDEYAVERVNALIQKYKNKVKFMIVTKCGSAGHGEVLRKVNVINVFGDVFDDIIILEHFESKKGTFNKLKRTYNIITVVDDYIGNIDVANEIGISTLVMKRDHNCRFIEKNKYDFVDNWDEAYNILDKRIQEKMKI